MKRAVFSLSALCMTALPAAAAPLDPGHMIRPELLGRALDALKAHRGEADQTHLVVVDYARRSDQPRAYVVDLVTGSVEAFRAAHGSGSDPDHDGYLDKFSDVPGSSASPQGAYLTAEEYSGKHGRSIRLDGLDTTNLNARARAIVIHAADYAEPAFLKQWGKLGRSNGCIVFSKEDLKTFLKDVPERTLIYVGK
ncbi:MAG TPA: murein L,D-transpeptidase catalytic domain family protein [Hyphomonas sp.]|nr:murein L,D-transpeptidase catalytic domain family protein [Hyphomonas sp.]